MHDYKLLSENTWKAEQDSSTLTIQKQTAGKQKKNNGKKYILLKINEKFVFRAICQQCSRSEILMAYIC